VTALVRDQSAPTARALADMGVRLATGDVLQRESMRAAMQGVNVVVHNAGRQEYATARATRRGMRAVNVAGTDNVLGLARELGVGRAVHVSSTQAFGDTGPQVRDETFVRESPCRTAYGQSKIDAHEIALEHGRRGLPLVIVCPNGVVAPNDASPWGYFLRLYVNRVMPPLAWSPDAIHGNVDVRDVAEGIALAAERGRIGETYLLSGEARTFRDWAGYWSKRPGAFTPFLWLPAWFARLLFAPLEPLQRLLGLPAFVSRETVRIGSASWHFTSEKAKRELGWTHRSAEETWHAALDAEIELLSRRKGQTLLQRLKPLDGI
jgi:dihydroflavonol-4-reductase